MKKHSFINFSGRNSPTETKSEKSSLTQLTGMSGSTAGTALAAKMQSESSGTKKRSAEAFMSIQLEKVRNIAQYKMWSGLSCLKMTLLVNEMITFQRYYMYRGCHFFFFAENRRGAFAAPLIFSAKNITAADFVSTAKINKLVANDFINPIALLKGQNSNWVKLS